MRGMLILTALALLAAPLAGAFTLESATLKDTKRYIVGFHDEIPEGVTRGASYQGGTVVEVDVDLVYAIVATDHPTLFEARVTLDERVRYMEWDDPHYASLFFVPNDARYGDAGHWGSKKIGAEKAWDRTLGSTSVKVGMLDSGINRGHEDLQGSRVLQGYDFHNNDNDPNDESGCSWHGTHTTGTAGATIHNGKGIAGLSQHTILPVKGLGSSGFGCTGSTSGLANGLKYIADQGSHISSNSWGGSGSTTIYDAITYAHNKGTIHIAAAGNSGPCTNCVSEPWKTRESIVIIVASTTSSDGQSSFSSEGPQIDVAAPGSSILSTTSGTSGYGSLSGTSMAAPHVTGTAALLKALKPTWGFADIDQNLKANAVDLGPSGKDDDFGHGRINADASTAAAGGGSPTYQCNDGLDNDGDGLIDYPNDPGCSSSTDNDEYNAPVGESRVYFEDMDDGAQGWSKSSSSDLWHTTSACRTPIGARHLAWTQDSSCTYNTGARVTNWAQSSAISLSGKTQATLKLKHQFDIEQYSGGAYDILRIQVSRDAVSWTTLQQWDSRGPDVTSWTSLSYDIDGFAGGNLYIRFWTDTVDSTSNSHAGWFIEDVEVTAA